MKRARAKTAKTLGFDGRSAQGSATVGWQARTAIHRTALPYRFPKVFHPVCSGIVICGSRLPDRGAPCRNVAGLARRWMRYVSCAFRHAEANAHVWLRESVGGVRSEAAARLSAVR